MRRKAKHSSRRRKLRYNSVWRVKNEFGSSIKRLKDLRGNTEDRRRRRAYLLKTFGNGKTANCVHCGNKLTDKTLTVDRIVPECRGGRYDRGNIQPSCRRCNESRGAKLCPVNETQAAMFKAMEDARGLASAASNPRKLRYKTVKFRRGILRGYLPYRKRTA